MVESLNLRGSEGYFGDKKIREVSCGPRDGDFSNQVCRTEFLLIFLVMKNMSHARECFWLAVDSTHRHEWNPRRSPFLSVLMWDPLELGPAIRRDPGREVYNLKTSWWLREFGVTRVRW